MNRDLAIVAKLLGDPARAAMLVSLVGGVSLPAGELAVVANVSPQTASEHLARLAKGRLLRVERRGRHRYYSMFGEEVASTVEAMLVLSRRPSSARNSHAARPEVGSLAYARTCYSHLAGWLGVRIAEALQQRSYLKLSDERNFALTDSGKAWFASLGIDIPSNEGISRFALRCLDWTERRPHLAGTLGCSLYKRFKELKWIVPIAGSRAVRVTLKGKHGLWVLLRIPGM
jgi:DNA-binding transcriptional ArsR family regulator